MGVDYRIVRPFRYSPFPLASPGISHNHLARLRTRTSSGGLPRALNVMAATLPRLGLLVRLKSPSVEASYR